MIDILVICCSDTICVTMQLCSTYNAILPAELSNCQTYKFGLLAARGAYYMILYIVFTFVGALGNKYLACYSILKTDLKTMLFKEAYTM